MRGMPLFCFSGGIIIHKEHKFCFVSSSSEKQFGRKIRRFHIQMENLP
jgi:hypothetical protein